MLRNAINNPKIPVDDLISIVKKFNAPVTAGTIKLYLLELNPPVMGWEGWEDAKAVYPAVGADQDVDMTSAVASVLGRLPGSHIFALDAVIKHFRTLIDTTKSAEPDEVYITKLALSVGKSKCFFIIIFVFHWPADTSIKQFFVLNLRPTSLSVTVLLHYSSPTLSGTTLPFSLPLLRNSRRRLTVPCL